MTAVVGKGGTRVPERDALAAFMSLSMLSLCAPRSVHVEKLGKAPLIDALVADGFIALDGYFANLTPKGKEELLRLGVLPEVALPPA